MEISEQKVELMDAITQHGAVSFHRRDAVGRWINAINELKAEGKVETELQDLDEQSSVFIVRAKAQP
jgi:hypothetical protein